MAITLGGYRAGLVVPAAAKSRLPVSLFFPKVQRKGRCPLYNLRSFTEKTWKDISASNEKRKVLANYL